MGSGSAASSCRLRCTSRKSSTGKPRAPKCSGSSPLMSDTEMLPTSCPPLTMAAPLTLPWCMRAKACTAGMRASTHTTSLESRPSSWSVLPPVAPISSGWRCKNSTTSHCEMTCSKCPRALKHARRWHTRVTAFSDHGAVVSSPGVVGTVRAPRKPLRTIHDIGAWRFFSRLMICPVLTAGGGGGVRRQETHVTSELGARGGGKFASLAPHRTPRYEDGWGWRVEIRGRRGAHCIRPR
mmetsp:Transcript_42234/g.135138  ORF Transcript_42234/g.135138 Transcript_42234/m.135138 type:complete len:238 (-) Transcript_42234:670-1383(-)